MEELAQRRLNFLRILFIVFLLSIPAFVTVLIISRSRKVTLSPSTSTIAIVTIVLSVFAAICIAAAYALPAFIKKKVRPGTPGQADIFLTNVVRSAMLQSVAIYGLVIGLLSNNLTIAMPFFAAAALSLLHSFPKVRDLEGDGTKN